MEDGRFSGTLVFWIYVVSIFFFQVSTSTITCFSLLFCIEFSISKFGNFLSISNVGSLLTCNACNRHFLQFYVRYLISTQSCLSAQNYLKLKELLTSNISRLGYMYSQCQLGSLCYVMRLSSLSCQYSCFIWLIVFLTGGWRRNRCNSWCHAVDLEILEEGINN